MLLCGTSIDTGSVQQIEENMHNCYLLYNSESCNAMQLPVYPENRRWQLSWVVSKWRKVLWGTNTGGPNLDHGETVISAMWYLFGKRVLFVSTTFPGCGRNMVRGGNEVYATNNSGKWKENIGVDSFPGSVEVEEGASGGFLYRPHLLIHYPVPHYP